MNQILIIPFGKFEVLREISDAIATKFNLEVQLATLGEVVVAKKRGDQFLADDFLPIIAKQVHDKDAIGGLGITIYDLFVPSLNFVFGLASRDDRVAIISLARLVSPNREVFLQRIIKEAIHELGHAILGLPHCQDRSCVMTFSNCLADTDFKGTAFCARCDKKIKSNGNAY